MDEWIETIRKERDRLEAVLEEYPEGDSDRDKDAVIYDVLHAVVVTHDAMNNKFGADVTIAFSLAEAPWDVVIGWRRKEED